MKGPVVIFCTAFMSACSPAPVLPSIATFGDSLATAGTALDKIFVPADVERDYAALRRSLIAEAGAVYNVQTPEQEACDPINPSAQAPGEPPARFADRCEASLLTLDGSGNVIAFTPSFPDSHPAVEARNARRLMAALADYGRALSALATSQNPKEVADALKGALDATQALADGLDKAQGGAGLRSADAAVISAGSELLATAAGEALEFRRYDLLRRIVRSADEAVVESSFFVASFVARSQAEALIEKYTALREADSVLPGDSAGLMVLDAALATTEAAENAAGWRAFWEIGVAHRAMLASLNAPPLDLDTLIEANKRIAALATQVQTLVKAIEDTD